MMEVAETPIKRPWWRRRLVTICASIVLVLLIAWVVVLPLIARPIVRSKLLAMVRQQLDADVEIGSVGYFPPFSASVGHLKIVVKDTDGKPVNLLWVKNIDISLGRSPFSEGPLVIESVTVDSPSVHVIRAPDGRIVGSRVGPATSQPASGKKISDLVQIRELSVSDANFVYEDRTVANAAPLAWRGLKLSATSAESAPASFACVLSGGSEKSATISAAGDLHVDDPRLKLNRCAVKLKFDPLAKESALPTEVQSLVRDYRVGGALDIDLTGDVPVNSSALTKAIAEVRVTPRGFGIHPTGFSEPIDDFAELTVKVSDGTALVETLRGGCGDDSLYVERAIIALPELPGMIRVNQFNGAIVMSARHPASYPAPVSNALAHADIRGPFFFEGNASVGIAQRPWLVDYRVRVKTDRAEITGVQHRVPLRNVSLDALITPQAIEVEQASADTLSGRISSSGRADLAATVPSYIAQIRARQLDLNALAQNWAKPGDQPTTVSGELSADLTLNGKGFNAGALDALTAAGNVQVVRGELFQVPVLRQILEKLDLKRAATAGNAACNFTLAQRKIHVTNATVDSPTLGVQGSGVVGLDGSLDTHVIVNVLSDWEKQIRELKNPITNVAGTIAGVLQKGLNTVTKTLLYQLHVGGTVGNPQVSVIAARRFGGDGGLGMRVLLRAVSLLLVGTLIGACDMITHSGAPPQVTASYYPPARLQSRPTLGMTLLRVDANEQLGLANSSLAECATDQLAEFLKKSNRFEVIDRADFAKMLEQQGLADIVKPGEFVRPADVRGVDYVLVASVTNLHIGKKEPRGAVGELAGVMKQSAMEKETIVHAKCNVALEIVEPATAAIVVSTTSEFNRTRSALDMGIDILPTATASASGEFPVSNEDRQRVIKLALDDAVAKSLPKLDRFLQSVPARPPTTAPVAATGPASEPGTVTANVTCKVCGAENDSAARFCRKCGAKLK